MVRDCCKVFVFESGGLSIKFEEDALAGMWGFWGWPSGIKERYALLL